MYEVIYKSKESNKTYQLIEYTMTVKHQREDKIEYIGRYENGLKPSDCRSIAVVDESKMT